jgi:hypothetical protein
MDQSINHIGRKLDGVTKIHPALPSPKACMSMGPWHLTGDTSLQDASVASHAPRRSLYRSSPHRRPLGRRHVSGHHWWHVSGRCEGNHPPPNSQAKPVAHLETHSAERLYIDGHETFRFHERKSKASLDSEKKRVFFFFSCWDQQ